ncbi:MAG: signal recognition particle protein Srp54 [Candidatus Asgardarchaeia archaeon]
MVLEKLGQMLYKTIQKISKFAVVDKKAIEEVIRDLQRALLQADVSVDLVMKLSERIRKKAFEVELPPGISRREHLIKIIYDELITLLGGAHVEPYSIKSKPHIIMLVGIQGSGKTTSAAKLAYYFSKQGLKTALVCADTYRPGAFNQLQQLAEKIGVPLYGHPESKDSVKIAKEGIKKFSNYDILIVDTAGRHKDEENLMKEMKQISEKINPSEIMLVIDGTIGQQAYTQALSFKQNTNIGSIFITKLDGSARGGGALSAVAATGAPIRFIGIGEHIEDIELFNPSKFVGRLLGIPDIEGLIKKVREAEISVTRSQTLKLLSGKLTLLDFYEQLNALPKLGSLQKILGMMGLGQKIPQELQGVAEEKLKKWKVILQSMNKEELLNPQILSGSRIRRIARGSGTTVKDVKDLLKQYRTMKSFMKRYGKKGLRKMSKVGLGGLFT